MSKNPKKFSLDTENGSNSQFILTRSEAGLLHKTPFLPLTTLNEQQPTLLRWHDLFLYRISQRMQEDLWSRGIGGHVVSVQNYTYQEAHVLRILSVTFFSLSIIAAILALYGFYIMRRSFRHEYVQGLLLHCIC